MSSKVNILALSVFIIVILAVGLVIDIRTIPVPAVLPTPTREVVQQQVRPSQRVVIFMGPMKPIGMEFESYTFDSEISFSGPDYGITALRYEDFSLQVIGSTDGVWSTRSNRGDWVVVVPDYMRITLVVEGEAISLNNNDVLLFHLSGQDPYPSIVMEVWRDGIFEENNMRVFFEKNEQEPEQWIPNWILDILDNIENEE